MQIRFARSEADASAPTGSAAPSTAPPACPPATVAEAPRARGDEEAPRTRGDPELEVAKINAESDEVACTMGTDARARDGDEQPDVTAAVTLLRASLIIVAKPEKATGPPARLRENSPDAQPVKEC